MFVEMPVINCRAVLADKVGIATLPLNCPHNLHVQLESSGVYRCPVYRTQRRGPTYIFTANLRSKHPAAKWVLAGVVLVMEIADL